MIISEELSKGKLGLFPEASKLNKEVESSNSNQEGSFIDVLKSFQQEASPVQVKSTEKPQEELSLYKKEELKEVPSKEEVTTKSVEPSPTPQPKQEVSSNESTSPQSLSSQLSNKEAIQSSITIESSKPQERVFKSYEENSTKFTSFKEDAPVKFRQAKEDSSKLASKDGLVLPSVKQQNSKEIEQATRQPSKEESKSSSKVITDRVDSPNLQNNTKVVVTIKEEVLVSNKEKEIPKDTSKLDSIPKVKITDAKPEVHLQKTENKNITQEGQPTKESKVSNAKEVEQNQKSPKIEITIEKKKPLDNKDASLTKPEPVKQEESPKLEVFANKLEEGKPTKKTKDLEAKEQPKDLKKATPETTTNSNTEPKKVSVENIAIMKEEVSLQRERAFTTGKSEPVKKDGLSIPSPQNTGSSSTSQDKLGNDRSDKLDTNNLVSQKFRSEDVNSAKTVESKLVQNTKNIFDSFQELVQKAKINVSTEGKNTAEISLYPKELGKMTLNLQLIQDKLEGRVLVETESVKNILLSDINQLKTELKSAGFLVEELRVEVRPEISQKDYAQEEKGKQNTEDSKSVFHHTDLEEEDLVEDIPYTSTYNSRLDIKV